MEDCIFLTNNDYNFIKRTRPLIGKGTDGSVYFINKDRCYKFYHHTEERIVSTSEPILDENGVNIRDYKDLSYVKVFDIIKYYDIDGVKLSREMALLNAINRQKDIALSDLPKKVIYVDNRVAGCELKYINSLSGVYLTCFLPLRLRLNICKDILNKIKELHSNYIYPIDLSQKDNINLFSRNNSNILLGYDLKPKLIDLDGRSTAYLESYSKKYESISNYSLAFLIFELLTSIELKDDLEEFDILEIQDILTKKNIPLDLSDKFVRGCPTMLDIEEFVNRYSYKKVRK